MSRKTITLEVDGPDQEALIRNYHALVVELNDLALTAPDGVVIDQLEDLAIERGRETLRLSLQQAVQKRLDDAEKKGPRFASAFAARSVRTAARAGGN
jgi:phage terminase Nu1 subunit (DNA packaging protein)